MASDDGVWVELRCNRCGTKGRMCVPIDRNVPERLRCGVQYGGGGSRRDVFCSGCQRTCFPSWDDLQAKVERELRAGGLGRHIKNGAVIVEC